MKKNSCIHRFGIRENMSRARYDMGRICKNWKKEGWLFAAHSITIFNFTYGGYPRLVPSIQNPMLWYWFRPASNNKSLRPRRDGYQAWDQNESYPSLEAKVINKEDKVSYSRVQKSMENFVFRPKMAIFRRAGIREGGFQYLILMI